MPVSEAVFIPGINDYQSFLVKVLMQPFRCYNHAFPYFDIGKFNRHGFFLFRRNLVVRHHDNRIGFFLIVELIVCGEEKFTVAVTVVAVCRLPGFPLNVMG